MADAPAMPALRTSVARDPLTPMQRRYAEARASGVPALTALRSAGCASPEANLCRYSANPLVQNEIARLQAQNRERNQVTRDEVITGLKEAIKDAKLIADPTAQIAGWREIAKMCGFYEPTRHEISLSPEAAQALDQLRELPTDRLLELAGPNVIDADFVLVLPDEDEVVDD